MLSRPGGEEPRLAAGDQEEGSAQAGIRRERECFMPTGI